MKAISSLLKSKFAEVLTGLTQHKDYLFSSKRMKT